MKFSKKTAHRLIIALSMFAPVLYLFGVMIGALVGYKDTFPFSASYEVIGESSLVDFNQKVSDNENFRQATFTPTAYDSENHGYRDFYISYRGVIGHTYALRFTIYDTFSNYDYSSWIFDGLSFTSPAFEGSHLGVYSGTGSYFFFRIYTTNLDPFNLKLSLNIFDITQMFGYGEEVSLDEFNRAFPESYYPYIESESRVYSLEVVPDNSQFLFNQFFPRGNFLERVGVNALSANPVGFAPFGTFLSYLDQNMLHASESQMALMIYGEVYWALHIVLADLVYHVAVFFPNLIERVFDWFGQKGLNDD